jgi:biopolymer transport protein ExbB
LGTVFGMIKAFNVIAVMGVGKPEALAGGISEALLTTAFGLSIAIPTIVIYNYLSNRVDKIIREMEVSCVDLLDLLTREDIVEENNILDQKDRGGEINYEISSSE